MSKLELVVNQDDVRRLGRRPARRIRRRSQPIDGDGVRFQEAVRQQLGNGVDAGAREGRDLVVAVEGVELAHRIPCLEGRETDDAGARQRDRRKPAHAQRVMAPAQQHDRDQNGRAQQGDPAQRGKDREQESDGVGVDDHQIDEARRHLQHVVLEIRQQNQHRQQGQRQHTGGGGAAQQREPEKIQNAPGEQESGHAHERGFGREHNRERGELRKQDQRRRPKAISGDEFRHAQMFAEKRQCGTHDSAPMPGNDPSLHCPSTPARCHKTVVKLSFQAQSFREVGKGAYRGMQMSPALNSASGRPTRDP